MVVMTFHLFVKLVFVCLSADCLVDNTSSQDSFVNIVLYSGNTDEINDTIFNEVNTRLFSELNQFLNRSRIKT